MISFEMRNWHGSCIGPAEPAGIGGRGRGNGMKTYRMLLAIAAVAGAAGLAGGAARAGTIIAPVSVAAIPAGTCCGGAYVVENIINQSGLSAGYTGGVTDFDSFTATATHSNPSNGNGFASNNNGVTTIDFNFDFGETVSLTRFALWNDTDVQAIGAFTLYAASDDSFGTLTSLGSFNAAVAGFPVAAQVFDMADATGRYFRLHATAFAPNTNLLNFGEVAFEGSVATVPAPGGLALFALALAGIGAVRRRRAA
ncbi:MAG: PEP-CTERM sorting domain-containing protein [Alphaproteobacteria bacterium]|nr:PEP-CTERM sorting domain-containing protein [Alphaproteobacteria bacterium]